MALNQTSLALARLATCLKAGQADGALEQLDKLVELGHCWDNAHDGRSLRAILSCGKNPLTRGQEATALAIVGAELRQRTVQRMTLWNGIALVGTPREFYRTNRFRSGRVVCAFKYPLPANSLIDQDETFLYEVLRP